MRLRAEYDDESEEILLNNKEMQTHETVHKTFPNHIMNENKLLPL